jgi:hypothetical protein
MSAETALQLPGRGVPRGSAFLRQLEARVANPRTQRALEGTSLALKDGHQEAAQEPVAPEEEVTIKLAKPAEDPSTAMTQERPKEPSQAMMLMQRIAEARLEQQSDRKRLKAWLVCECARFLSGVA